ncbi:MAG: IS1 family transposase [Armatimonadetes bacterium]|nr:IS1 family transposase [Armatimonadota bacterium]
MITEQRSCHRCHSTNIVKNGRNTSGTQTYNCKDCNCCHVLDSKQPSRSLDTEAILRTYSERQSFRATARIFGVSEFFVRSLFKKKLVP